MILRCLFMIRKSDVESLGAQVCFQPELLVAWDEYSVDENREGWKDACARELTACEDDVEVSRVVDVEVDAALIRNQLLPPEEVVQGKVEDPPHRDDQGRNFRALAECPKCSEMDFNGRRCYSCGYISELPGCCPNV